MDYINELQKYLSDKYDCYVKISDDLNNPDLELSEWYTADDYTLHVMTNDARNIDWENDVYYYEPSFEDIIDRIKECADDEPGEAIIHISDIDTYLSEYEVKDYIEEHTEDEDE